MADESVVAKSPAPAVEPEIKHVPWFDLSGFGAMLRVVPLSPLRGIRLMCLEVRDTKMLNAYLTRNDENLQEASGVFRERLTALGFGETPQKVLVDLPDQPDLTQVYRFFSPRVDFTLTDLQTLFPTLTRLDVVSTPVPSISLKVTAPPVLAPAWSAFVRDTLVHDAVGVWTPRINPFDHPWVHAPVVSKMAPDRSEGVHPILQTLSATAYHGISGVLDRHQYRSNSLIPYFADLPSALAAGWREDELVQTDLPYALPLWISPTGQVTGLTDVRHVPEIMDMHPDRVYKLGHEGSPAKGLAVATLRECARLCEAHAASFKTLAALCENPESITRAQELQDTLTELVRRDLRAHMDYPQIPSRFSGIAMTSAGISWRGATVAERGEPEQASIKPLREWQSADFDVLLQGAKPFFEAAPALTESALRAAFDRALGLQREAAQEAATALRESTVAQLDARATPAGRIVDVGVKIGGARKDYGSRALTFDDLAQMNDLERELLVIKKNIWPPLDYPAMRDAGVEPKAALAIKLLKDSLSGRVQENGDVDLATRERQYIDSLSAVRDAMAPVKTLAEFCQACTALYAEALAADPEAIPHRPFRSAWGRQWGINASAGIYASSAQYASNGVAQIGNDWGKTIRQKMDKTMWEEDYTSRAMTDDERWAVLSKPRPTVDSEVLLEKKSAQKTKATEEANLHCPHLEKVTREGTDWRQGRDVTGEDLLEHFGFRAVEFGNWLPQDERQGVLNFAYDSFCDLAHILDLPPKAVSFDGELAIAFGSRGAGGKGAAWAHFEPARNVINLTRLKGAGMLAHEWFHALDFTLGDKREYACERDATAQTVMGELARSMSRRLATPDEIRHESAEKALRGKSNIPAWMMSARTAEPVREAVKALVDKRFDELTVAYYTAAREALAPLKDSRVTGAWVGPSGASDVTQRHEDGDSIWRALKAVPGVDRTILSAVKKSVMQNVNFMIYHLSVAATAEAAHDLGISPDRLPNFLGGSNAAKTDYLIAAEALDESRSKGYWATPRELFARAGATWVSTLLEEAGLRSDYLVYGADSGRHIGNVFGNPNAGEADMAVMRPHFAALLDGYRLAALAEPDGAGRKAG